MRISDWGSDGCASDRSGAVRMESDVSGAGVSGSAEVTLGAGTLAATGVADLPIELAGGTIGVSLASGFDGAELVAALDLAGGSRLTLTAAATRSGSGYAVTAEEIGRASCRERVCPYV